MAVLTEQQARQRVIARVRQVKEELGLQSPPSYTGIEDSVARHLKLTVKEAELEMDEGEYLPDYRLIVVDPRIADPDRLNFTFFHEITHHLIREDDELYSFLDQYAPQEEQFRAVLEAFCNIGAAEFLIPSQDMRDIITTQGFSIMLIEQLETVYPASKPAIAFQLAQCAPHRCFVVICEYGLVPQRAQPQLQLLSQTRGQRPQLFVRYASSSPSARYPIGRYVVIPHNHVIDLAYQQRSKVNGQAAIPFRSGKQWICDCEAFFYKGKVYAVFNASPPPGPTEEQHSFLDLM